jgi:hypothetical protein
MCLTSLDWISCHQLYGIGEALNRRWSGDALTNSSRMEELVKSGCWEGHTTFVSPDSNSSPLHIVKKRVEMRLNMCVMSSNCVCGGGIYRVAENEIWFFFEKKILNFWSHNGKKTAKFFIQMTIIEFKQKKSRPIRSCHIAIGHRLQWRSVPTRPAPMETVSLAPSER